MFFKKRWLPVFLLLFQTCIANDTTSNTFFSVRPHYQSAAPEKVAGISDHIYYDYGPLQVTVFGGQSTNPHDLATFFTPFGKSTLRVVERDLLDAVEKDVVGNNFNIVTNGADFSSDISFRPRLTNYGIGLTYKQNLCTFFDGMREKTKFEPWFEISTSLQLVETTINFSETVINDGGGVAPSAGLGYSYVSNMIEAFNQERFNYGKIDAGKTHSKGGLADIELKFGVEKEEDKYLFNGYVGLLIPTGNKPKAVYVFEPIVGNNNHWGITGGGLIDFDVWQHKNKNLKLQFITNFHLQYLFENSQKRSFDVKNNPWSRYLELYESFAQATTANGGGILGSSLHTPGINLLTRNVEVSPGFSFNSNNGFIFNINSWGIEVGYNLFCRQSETVHLKHGWTETEVVIKKASGQGNPNPIKTINKQRQEWNSPAFNLANYIKYALREEDLDLSSAAHPSILSHTLYASGKYTWNEKKNPMFVGFGASYEFGRENAILHRWLLWGKYGISF